MIKITNWKLLDIVRAVNGKLINGPKEELLINGIQQDSRKIEKGFLFVPLIAERNGHDFVKQAVKAGAVASFWSDDLEDAPTDFPLILVEDTLEALQQTAAWYLKTVNPKVVGITGSNGKTTTKDMTAKVLESHYQTHKTAGNFNNAIGLPLTILDMVESTEILVLEMGTSNPGEIGFLSNLAQPDLAVVTMIGESHIESFGSREKLTKEKMAITSALKKDSLFIYPENEQLIADNLPKNARIKNFSIDRRADIYAENISEEINSTQFTVIEKNTDSKILMEIPVPGRYNVNNALIAILVGLEYGVSLAEAKKQLAELEMTKDRLEWIDGINDWSILNDAYNASPSSMRAVLNYFQAIKTTKAKVVVLGDILELGNLSGSLHGGLADAIKLDSYDFVFLYGKEMKVLYEKLKKEENSENLFHFSSDKTKLLQMLKEKVKSSSYILFKSSNGTDLLSLVDDLRLSDK